MKVYIRKVMHHDITHEVSLTEYVHMDFFNDEYNVSFQIRGEGYMYNVTFNDATDMRFGGDFKALCRQLEIHEGDFLIMSKTSDNLYSIRRETMSEAANKSYFPFFTGRRRHLIASINGNELIKHYVR